MAVTATAIAAPQFEAIPACWVCGGTDLRRYHRCELDFRQYATQDPGLHAYTGCAVWFVQCGACGFGQPEALPTLPNFFDRMYDQQWSEAWIEEEFSGTYKDVIFDRILTGLDRHLVSSPRRLLDVGAHAGRFMHLAQLRGWQVEGIELNPRTAACAARRTGAPVHQVNAQSLALRGDRYDAIVVTDVLEHIPEPVRLLRVLRQLSAPAGILAIKVPNGSAQWVKERCLAKLTTHQVSLADNLVHVNQFTPKSLASAIEAAGFSRVRVAAAAPEFTSRPGVRGLVSRTARRAVFAAASIPGAVNTPIALHLQAWASSPQ
jgi:2-polyprenyl-3-methyl-5-hydroxy-6-metoxy-1,4-benzoquinol methylase